MPSAHRRVAIVYDPGYILSLAGLEKLHPFDPQKYAHIVDALLLRRMITLDEVIAPDPMDDEALALVHAKDYLARMSAPDNLSEVFEAEYMRWLPKEVMRRRVVAPLLLMAGGTLRAAQEALHCGGAINIGGGFHHAHADRGGGFCLVADVAVAIRYLQRHHGIRRALIVDLDVHQGDGNATIFADDPEVFTFSMHQEDLFPFPKATSDLDVPFPAGIGDEEYLALVEQHVPSLLEHHRPEIVFYIAGSDILAGDLLGDAQVSRNGLIRRDTFVWAECRRRAIPCVMVLGGGYSPDSPRAHTMSISTIIERSLSGSMVG